MEEVEISDNVSLTASSSSSWAQIKIRQLSKLAFKLKQDLKVGWVAGGLIKMQLGLFLLKLPNEADPFVPFET